MLSAESSDFPSKMTDRAWLYKRIMFKLLESKRSTSQRSNWALPNLMANPAKQQQRARCCMDGPSGLDWSMPQTWPEQCFWCSSHITLAVRLEKNRANNGLLPDVILLDIQMPGMTGWVRDCAIRACIGWNSWSRSHWSMAASIVFCGQRSMALSMGLSWYVRFPAQP